jgi:NAD(P)H-dependent FMN reductase
VGYGSAGGTRAVENLRLVMGELMVADVRAQVALSLFTDFENFSTFKPQALQEKSVHTMLDQLVAWGTALRSVRQPQDAAAGTGAVTRQADQRQSSASTA